MDVGHGVFLSEEAKKWIFERRLPIEMCLSSALKARMVTSMKDHPALQLIRENYPVCICTDDPLIFRTTNTLESQFAKEILDFSDEQIEELYVSSLSYKF